ncbi:T9SS type A sorting domain-containing protein [Hymenobacter frigidus]|uniref:T9SS type A sorting domain-containing protein n=1 Tax=Hymenobacter frigidus TaxID=1524095 RepID=UPI00166477A8|nr:T9SS type A sorting domain-containing protein [Hymenobacter frigidus]
MRTLRYFLLLTASVLLSAEAWAQKPVNHLETALAKLRPAAVRAAGRGTQQTVSRPGRAVQANWDTNTQAWSTAAVVETYVYDSRANLVQEVFADSATTRLTSRSLYTYNAQNRNTEELYQQWQNGAWVNTGRFVTTYDAQDNPTQELDQEWQNGAWVTAHGYQYLNTYSNNVLTEQIELRWNNGVFGNSQRLLFTVASGQWTDVVQQLWKLGAWENEARFVGIVWHNWPAQQPASLREQEWQGVWEDVLRYTFTYAPNGTVVELEEEAVGPGTWALSARSTDTFDSFGNELGFRSESRQGTAWVLEFEDRNLLTYTAANDVRRRVSQRFGSNGGSTGFENQERVHYSNFLSITLGTAPAALAAQTQLYPNPTTGTATLVLAGLKQPGGVRVDVFNTLGQLLLQRTARPGAGLVSETLDLHGLPAGVYSVRLHTPEGTIVKRLVKE